MRGRLADVIDEVRRVRAEARARHGWIMDTYLLRHPDDAPDPVARRSPVHALPRPEQWAPLTDGVVASDR